MLGGASSKGHMQREGGGSVIRQAHLMAVVGALLIAVLLVGCAGGRSEAPEEEVRTEATKEQVHAETTLEKQSLPQATSSAAASSEAPCSQTQSYSNLRVFRLCKLQARSPKATTEETRCERTRAFKDYKWWAVFTTNDVPGCPKGGLLSGTDEKDFLNGKKGEDEIRGLRGGDEIVGGDGDDVIYGGPGSDVIVGAEGEDVLYGGDGGELLSGLDDLSRQKDTQRDELYCGPGKDQYEAGKLDYVDSSCEEKMPFGGDPL